MAIGPVEYLLIEFPGSRFRGDIVPELVKLVDGGLISIIDLVFVSKDADGTVTSVELDALDDTDTAAAFGALEGAFGSLVSDDDIAAAGAALEPGSSAGLLVFENVWAGPFVDAIRAAGGVLVANQRIPADLVDAALALAVESEGEAS